MMRQTSLIDWIEQHAAPKPAPPPPVAKRAAS
jgi:hypothetical protein